MVFSFLRPNTNQNEKHKQLAGTHTLRRTIEENRTEMNRIDKMIPKWSTAVYPVNYLSPRWFCFALAWGAVLQMHGAIAWCHFLRVLCQDQVMHLLALCVWTSSGPDLQKVLSVTFWPAWKRGAASGYVDFKALTANLRSVAERLVVASALSLRISAVAAAEAIGVFCEDDHFLSSDSEEAKKDMVWNESFSPLRESLSHS